MLGLSAAMHVRCTQPTIGNDVRVAVVHHPRHGKHGSSGTARCRLLATNSSALDGVAAHGCSLGKNGKSARASGTANGATSSRMPLAARISGLTAAAMTLSERMSSAAAAAAPAAHRAMSPRISSLLAFLNMRTMVARLVAQGRRRRAGVTGGMTNATRATASISTNRPITSQTVYVNPISLQGPLGRRTTAPTMSRLMATASDNLAADASAAVLAGLRFLLAAILLFQTHRFASGHAQARKT